MFTLEPTTMLRQFAAYYRPYRHLFFLDFGCALVVGLLELGFPLAVNQFVDRLLPGQDWGLILLAAGALLGVYVLNTALQYVVTYWGHMLGINIETDMRRNVFEHLQKLSFRFFDNTKTGHMVARITTDLQDIPLQQPDDGGKDIFVESDDTDLYAAIDAMSDKLERQVQKYKQKMTEHNHESLKHQPPEA